MALYVNHKWFASTCAKSLNLWLYIVILINLQNANVLCFNLIINSNSAFSDAGARGKPGLGRCTVVANWRLDCRKGIYPCSGAFLVNELVHCPVLFEGGGG